MKPYENHMKAHEHHVKPLEHHVLGSPLVPTPHPGQLITVAVLSSGFLPGTLTATYGVSPVTV